MHDLGSRIPEVAGLKHALPYLRLFQGRIFVVKLSGEGLADRGALLRFLEQVELLHRLGIRIVLVHGGGPQTSALQEALGLEVRQIEGRRVTDARTLAAAIAATAGSARTELLATSRPAGLPAVGLSGVDAATIVATRRPPVAIAGAPVDFGFVGDVAAVDRRLIDHLLAGGFVPVVSPLAVAEDGQVLNVNADTIAAELAVALGAAKLILALGVPGLLEQREDAASLVHLTDLAGLAELRERGALTGGMLPKARAVERALEGGVPRVHLIPFAAPDALLVELFTNEGIGTMVVASHAELEAAIAESGAS